MQGKKRDGKLEIKCKKIRGSLLETVNDQGFWKTAEKIEHIIKDIMEENLPEQKARDSS